MALRQVPLRRSLARHNTILGAERTPVLLVMLAGGMLVFTGLTVLTTILGALIAVIGVFGLRAATAVHPQITQVYKHFVKFHRHYPARTTIQAPMPHREIIKIGERNG